MTPRSRRLLPVATIALLAVLPAGAGAAQLTVDSTADGPDATPGNGVCATGLGQCTLRAAIGEANALFGADAIVVPAGTYATGSPLTVSSTMSITGPAGARATVVDGAAGAAVLEISASAAGASVRGLTFTGAGRGIRVDAPDVVIDQVSVRGNAISGAATQYASGIFLGAPTARVLVTRSLITGNTVTSTLDQAQGAGITVWDSGASLTVVASTIADNQANGSGSGAFGGGVHVRFGSRAVLRHATLAGNRTTAGSVATSGGNLYATPAGPFAAAQAVVADSVLTGGQAVSGPNCFGPVIAEGRNIDSGTSCGFGAGHLTGTDPLLGALADNGGPTDSMAPGLASPARDQAALCPDGGLDQRGAPAPTGPACDIGAAELGADLGVSVQASRPDALPGGDVTYLLRVVNNGVDAAPAAALDLSAGGATPVLASASTGGCTLAVRCELGTLARGQEVAVTVVARAGTAPIALTARASSALPDPAPGNDTAAVTTPVAGSAAPAAPGPTPPPPPPAADLTPPVLGALRLAAPARTARAVRIRTSLSEAATVTLGVQRLVPGRRVRTACRATARTGRACVAVRPVGSLRRTLRTGAATLIIPARLGGRVLAPGRYRLRAVATDAAGNRSRPRTLTVRVTR